jgi:hypothetical protein
MICHFSRTVAAAFIVAVALSGCASDRAGTKAAASLLPYARTSRSRSSVRTNPEFA